MELIIIVNLVSLFCRVSRTVQIVTMQSTITSRRSPTARNTSLVSRKNNRRACLSSRYVFKLRRGGGFTVRPLRSSRNNRSYFHMLSGQRSRQRSARTRWHNNVQHSDGWARFNEIPYRLEIRNCHHHACKLRFTHMHLMYLMQQH